MLDEHDLKSEFTTPWLFAAVITVRRGDDIRLDSTLFSLHMYKYRALFLISSRISDILIERRATQQWQF